MQHQITRFIAQRLRPPHQKTRMIKAKKGRGSDSRKGREVVS